MNRPKAIGTAGESAVRDWLKANGFPACERRALAGSHDLGDLTGLGPLVVEVKAGQAAQTAAAAQDARITTWMRETLVETQNAQADYGVLVCKRAGVGAANADRWWAFLDSHDLAELLTGRPHTSMRSPRFPVRMTLADAVTVLRHAGYGDALPMMGDVA